MCERCALATSPLTRMTRTARPRVARSVRRDALPARRGRSTCCSCASRSTRSSVTASSSWSTSSAGCAPWRMAAREGAKIVIELADGAAAGVRRGRPTRRWLRSAREHATSARPARAARSPTRPSSTSIDRTGGGDHFQVVVTSPSLVGLSLVEQHRRVYEALAAPLADGTIHELRIRTKGAS